MINEGNLGHIKTVLSVATLSLFVGTLGVILLSDFSVNNGASKGLVVFYFVLFYGWTTIFPIIDIVRKGLNKDFKNSFWIWLFILTNVIGTLALAQAFVRYI